VGIYWRVRKWELEIDVPWQFFFRFQLQVDRFLVLIMVKNKFPSLKFKSCLDPGIAWNCANVAYISAINCNLHASYSEESYGIIKFKILCRKENCWRIHSYISLRVNSHLLSVFESKFCQVKWTLRYKWKFTNKYCWSCQKLSTHHYVLYQDFSYFQWFASPLSF